MTNNDYDDLEQNITPPEEGQPEQVGLDPAIGEEIANITASQQELNNELDELENSLLILNDYLQQVEQFRQQVEHESVALNLQLIAQYNFDQEEVFTDESEEEGTGADLGQIETQILDPMSTNLGTEDEGPKND